MNGFYEPGHGTALSSGTRAHSHSWGVSSVFQSYDKVGHIPPPPDEEYFLITFFGFLVVGLYFLGKVSRGLKR